jgi:hypothetical protein
MSLKRCRYRSQDDFQELKSGAVIEFANGLFEAGYITHARISNESSGKASELAIEINNLLIGAQRRIRGFRSSSLPLFSKTTSVKSMALQCLPTQKCRWLHLCFRKRPYATKVVPLHVCKDEGQNDFTDASFFRALRKTYYKQKSWKEKLLFKLKKIDFAEVRFLYKVSTSLLIYYFQFELCPDDFVDGVIPDKLPPTVDEYDFQPPPPPKKVAPIGPEHMMHLFTS